MHPLDGVQFKLARAQSEVNVLRAMETAFFEETKHSIVRAEHNSVSGKDVYRFKIDGIPFSLESSLGWGGFIGEIAHNLRCALNYLVYQLALLNSANKPETVAGDKGLQFPIFAGKGDFKRKGKRAIKLLALEHQTIIEGLQPYQSISKSLLPTVDLSKWSGRNSPLFWLEEINNMDKHRVIHVTGVRAGSWSVGWWGEVNHPIDILGIFNILEDGTECFEVPPDVHVYPQIHPFIAFRPTLSLPPELEKKPVCLVFDLIARTVSEIIGLFESDFP
jgi:hypothetical protein